ncbi:MAG: ATP-binding domain-containing protein, partial [Oscillospiraceae bacterium]
EFVAATNGEDTAKQIYDIYRKEAVAEGIENVQILSPYRKSGHAGVNAMNPIVREIANPATSMRPQVQHGARIFRVGDKVMQMKNVEDVSNGDVGFVTDACTTEDKGASVTIEFSGNRVVNYYEDGLDMLDLAYAMSIHKSQGSEYATVIVPVLFEFYVMLKRDIYYTGITRAKKKVILVGQKQALFRAIHTISELRNTRLSLRIQLAVKERLAAIPEKPPEQLKIG